MLDQIRFKRFEKSRDYRSSYIAGRVRLAIAAQIRALRDQFSGTQAEFAEKIETTQSVVSRLENPDYGRMSVQTLLDIAEKLDVALIVKFVSYDRFFTLLDDDDLSPDALRVEPFATTVERQERIRASDNVLSFGLREKIFSGVRSNKPREPEHRSHEENAPARAKAKGSVSQLDHPFSESLSKGIRKGTAA